MSVDRLVDEVRGRGTETNKSYDIEADFLAGSYNANAHEPTTWCFCLTVPTLPGRATRLTGMVRSGGEWLCLAQQVVQGPQSPAGASPLSGLILGAVTARYSED